MSEDDSHDGTDYRYGYSRVTGTWYRVYEWEDKGDGKIVAQSKEKVDREEVPQRVLDATNEERYSDEQR